LITAVCSILDISHALFLIDVQKLFENDIRFRV
jgi:hypothetical protein